MNLDIIINQFYPDFHNLRNKVILNNYIKKDFTYHKHSKVLCVLCPPWHVSKISTLIIRRNLREYNYSYLTYDIHPDIISPDYKSTKRYLTQIIKQIKSDIKKIDNKHKFKEIHIIGFSIGSLYAINVANKIEKVNKITLVTIGNSFAACLYDSVCTSEIKEKLIEQGMTEKKYNDYMKEFNPEENISGLKNKEIKIILSKLDQVLKYKYGLKQIQKMRKVGINPQVFVNKDKGHYRTNIKFLLHPKNDL